MRGQTERRRREEEEGGGERRRRRRREEEEEEEERGEAYLASPQDGAYLLSKHTFTAKPSGMTDATL